MKIVSRSFRRDTARLALKIRRAERLFLRVHRPIQSKGGQERRARLAHSAASTDSSMMTGLTHSLQQLDCGEALEAEDAQPIPKIACEFDLEVLVLSLTHSFLHFFIFFSATMTRNHQPQQQKTPSFIHDGIKTISRGSLFASPMSTGSDEYHPCFQGENVMEGLTTDYDPMDEDLDDTIIFDLVLEGDHTYTSFGSREYMLPNDDSWTLAEADLHHVIHNLVLDKKAFLGSAAAFEGRVLDVGTGIGLWAIDSELDHPFYHGTHLEGNYYP